MSLAKHPTIRFKGDEIEHIDDDIAVEEPLEIFVDDFPYAVTLRMPGDDLNLVRGFCFTEGMIASEDDLAHVGHCTGPMGTGRVLVTLSEGVRGERASFLDKRSEYLSKSSCGVCGKSSVEEIYTDIEPVRVTEQVSFREVLALKALFEAQKKTFDLTGATHSVAIFTREKEVLGAAEDVGRHNAFDKAIGQVVAARREADAALAVVSSRLSFEMVQKAGVLGVEVLAGVSAPTLLAIRFAERLGITLVGFLRKNRMNVYTHPERIAS